MNKLTREEKVEKLLRDSQTLLSGNWDLTEICTRCEKVVANIERVISLIKEDRREREV